MELSDVATKRVSIGSLTPAQEGDKPVVAGWVYDVRDLGKVCFVVLRDVSGEIQVTGLKAKADRDVFDAMRRVSRESVVVVHGRVVKNDKASGGRELIPSSFEVVSTAEHPLPIDVSDHSKTDLPKRLDVRFLDFHRRKTQAIFRIQSTLSNAFREHFVQEGFIEMQPPCIIGASSEGGTDLFTVRYFEQPAYLAQSPQLYKQMLACSMEKVFMTTPVWRAEKHNTVRHINEIRQYDIEAAFDDQMATMRRLEKVLAFMVSEVLAKNKEDLELLGVTDLKVPKGVYMSYDDAITLLKKEGVNIEHGEDFSPEAEKKLGELHPDDCVFVYSWPKAIRTFYIMPRDGDINSEYSEGFDAIYKGTELSSGGQRIHLPDLLIKMLEYKGLEPAGFKDYIDSFRFGAPPHAGWSIGLERVTMMICNLDNIREATMFPRDRDRLTP